MQAFATLLPPRPLAEVPVHTPAGCSVRSTCSAVAAARCRFFARRLSPRPHAQALRPRRVVVFESSFLPAIPRFQAARAQRIAVTSTAGRRAVSLLAESKSSADASADASTAPRTDTPVVTVRDLRKAYGDKIAVDGVSLDVYPGEIFGLLGPNAAGKTTTLMAITTLLKPDSGEIKICGYDTRTQGREARASLGYIGQDFAVDKARGADARPLRVAAADRERRRPPAGADGAGAHGAHLRSVPPPAGARQAGDRVRDEVRRAGGLRGRADGDVLRGHPEAAGHRAGDPARPRGADPGRADGGPRHRVAPGALAPHPRAPGRGRGHPPHLPLPRRGGHAGGPAGDHQRRAHHRPGDPLRAQRLPRRRPHHPPHPRVHPDRGGGPRAGRPSEAPLRSQRDRQLVAVQHHRAGRRRGPQLPRRGAGGAAGAGRAALLDHAVAALAGRRVPRGDGPHPRRRRPREQGAPRGRGQGQEGQEEHPEAPQQAQGVVEAAAPPEYRSPPPTSRARPARVSPVQTHGSAFEFKFSIERFHHLLPRKPGHARICTPAS